MPEFYIIIAWKIFFPNFGGHIPPEPRLLRLCCYSRHKYGTWSRQHGLDRAGRQSMFSLDDKLVSIGRDELHVHRIRTFAAAELVLLDFSHFLTAHHHNNNQVTLNRTSPHRQQALRRPPIHSDRLTVNKRWVIWRYKGIGHVGLYHTGTHHCDSWQLLHSLLQPLKWAPLCRHCIMARLTRPAVSGPVLPCLNIPNTKCIRKIHREWQTRG